MNSTQESTASAKQPVNETGNSRLRPQFSLRTFLILAVLVSAPISYFASFVNRANRERNVIEVLSDEGGQVRFVYNTALDEHGNSIPDAVPPGPEWLKSTFGENIFAEVYALNLDGSAIYDLKPVVGLRGLVKLEFKDCINLKSLQGIKHLPDLLEIRIDTCHNIKTLSLGELRSISRVEILMSDGLTAVHLGDLDNVPYLFFSYCSKLDSLDGLEGKTIGQLSFEGCGELNDLSALTKVKELQSLKLMYCPTTDLTILNSVNGLQTLKLSDRTRADLADLAGLDSVTELNLAGCRELADLSGLFELKQLKSVSLPFENSRIEAQVAELRKKLPNTDVIYRSTPQ